MGYGFSSNMAGKSVNVIPKGYYSREMMIQGTHPHVLLSLLLSAYPIFVGLPIWDNTKVPGLQVAHVQWQKWSFRWSFIFCSIAVLHIHELLMGYWILGHQSQWVIKFITRSTRFSAQSSKMERNCFWVVSGNLPQHLTIVDVPNQILITGLWGCHTSKRRPASRIQHVTNHWHTLWLWRDQTLQNGSGSGQCYTEVHLTCSTLEIPRGIGTPFQGRRSILHGHSWDHQWSRFFFGPPMQVQRPIKPCSPRPNNT